VQQHADVVRRTAHDSCHVRRRQLLDLPKLKNFTLLSGKSLETVTEDLSRLSRFDKAISLDRRLQP
jgi:hypothetical protein